MGSGGGECCAGREYKQGVSEVNPLHETMYAAYCTAVHVLAWDISVVSFAAPCSGQENSVYPIR